MCFYVNFAKLLRTPILFNIYEWLYLHPLKNTSFLNIRGMKLKNDTLSAFLARRRKYTEKASNNKVLEPAKHMIGISSHQIKNKHEEKSSNKKLC